MNYSSTFFLSIIWLQCIINTTAVDTIGYNADQHEALRRFYLSTKMYSEASRYLHNWSFDNYNSTDTTATSSSYCNFTGVTCDHNFMVTNLELNNTSLAGSLPDTFTEFPKLRRLRLFNNSIQGTIPSSLLRLPSLLLINLGQNQFSGTFPSFAASSTLSRIALNRNAISGTIPTSMCELTELVVLEISHLTRMRGSIPECFGSLSALKAFRLTNIGLSGTIPSDLCTVREMNGLTPNTFGCDAIACPIGTYQRGNGRQSNVERPCTQCLVPSNIIGTTTCQWQERNVPTQSPTLIPSISTGPPSHIPSSLPQEEQLPTIYPMPATRYPINSNPMLLYPSVGPTFETLQPSFIQSSRNGSSTKPGFIVGMILLGMALIAFVIIVFVSKHRPLLPNHKRLSDETSSHPGSSLEDFFVQNDLLPVYNSPSVVNMETNKTESKEFDVGDDVSFHLKELSIIRFDSVKDGIDLFPIKQPMNQDTIQDSSNQTAKHNGKSVQKHTQSNLSNARKVRFSIPDQKSSLQLDKGNETIGATNPTLSGRDDWITWILNPLFDQIASCGTPCRDIQKGEVDIKSSVSMDSSYSNLSAFFAAHPDPTVSSPSDIKNGEKNHPLPPSLISPHPVGSSLLGIRGLNSMNDDNSLNSLDAPSDINGNRGTIFRPTIESRQRRIRTVWDTIHDNLDDGTGEV